MRFLFFTLLLFFAFGFDVKAQLQATFHYPDGYNICGQTVLNVEIKNNGSAAIGPIISEFDLNSYMTIDSVWTEIQNHFLNITGNKIRYVFDTLVGGQSSIFFHIQMSTGGGCNLVSCSNAYLTTDKIQLKYNSKTETTENKQSLKSACLTYDENLFDKRLYSAFIGDTITRRIILLNTGGGTFDGYIEIKDIFGDYIEVDSIYSNNPGHTILSHSKTNDSTRVFQARFPDIQKGDSIIIYEKVIVEKCIEDDHGKSSIYINWSCDNSLCKEITPYPVIAQVLKNNKNPEVIITKVVTPQSNCLNTTSTNRYMVKNIGLRPAMDLRFSVAAENYNTYTYVDRNSLSLSDTSGLVVTNSVSSVLNPGVPDPFKFDHTCIIPDPLHKWDFTVETLLPEDSFFVEYESFHCCPGDDTSNIELLFEAWYLSVEYTDQCRDDTFQTASAGDIRNKIELKQLYEPVITDMNGFVQDTATLEIYNYAFTTDFYRSNMDSAAFKVVLKVDTGLVFIPDKLRITSIYNHTLWADDIQLVLGGASDGYQDTMLVATFILPDTFRIDPVYFGRFIRNSSVKFDLYPECPAKEPASRFNQEVYFIPDLNCSNACEILLSSVTEEISVHCPGCLTPGWVAYYFKAKRLTIGEQDTNDDRLPDNATFTEADENLIKLNRCIPGDTVETELRAFVQDGDPVLGKTINDLANNGPNSFQFLYSYNDMNLTLGKLFKMETVKVIIHDVDQNYISSGSDTVSIPTSTVTKIENPVDSLPDARFFYDLSLDTLYKYGLEATYQFENADQIQLISTFSIREFSNFYRTSPPANKDPWLVMEQLPLLFPYYSNFLYLTGAKDTPDDIDKDAVSSFNEDPNSLDSTMLYWCEAHSGASTLVGRNKVVTINIPASVQCKTKASVTFSLAPSGGIFKNPFPFEYRNLVTLDSLKLNVPSGYKFTEWIVTNSIDRPDGFLEFEPCTVTDTIQVVNETGPSITIILDTLFRRETQFSSSPCLNGFMYGDENITTTIEYSIVPECDLPETKKFFSTPVLLYHLEPHHIPEEDKLKTSPSIQKVNAKLKLSPATNEAFVSRQEFCYPINLEETEGYPAGFSFIKINSFNNKIEPISLTDVETQEVYFPDSTGLFKLDTTDGNSIRQFNLCLRNICGEVVSRDSLRFIYGHDCWEYPDSIFSNICKYDSLKHYAVPSSLDVQSFLDGPEEIAMCQPFSVTYDYQFTGLGSIDNLLLKVLNQPTEGVTVLSGSLAINGASADISQTYDSASAAYLLGPAINTIFPQGLKSGDNFQVTLSFTTDCQYTGIDISTQLIMITASCDTLSDDTLSFAPAALTGYPVSDTKSATASFLEFKNTGGQNTATIRIHNTATTPTVNQTGVTFMLPQDFTYQGMITPLTPNAVSDSMITWILNPAINAGEYQELQFIMNYGPVANCDSLGFEIVVSDISESCAGTPCIQRDSAFYFTEPVVCYPCPPVLTKDDRCKGLPIFNTIYWNYDQLYYCPGEYNYLYSVYYSATPSGPFQMIHQTSDTTFLHDSISAYDGCYYITATDTAGLNSDNSNIICNTTCNEQFKCKELFISNLITPNGDNLNEFFLITGAYLKLKVEMYNRWGEPIFKSDDYSNNWSGKEQKEGLYFYHVFVDGSEEACVGWIQIIK